MYIVLYDELHYNIIKNKIIRNPISTHYTNLCCISFPNKIGPCNSMHEYKYKIIRKYIHHLTWKTASLQFFGHKIKCIKHMQIISYYYLRL